MDVIWTEKSKDSLLAIYEYIFDKSPKNALIVLEELTALGNSLSDEKLDYSKDLIINDEAVRFVSKWSYKIIYERFNQKVIILDVFGSYQNPDKLLSIFE